MTIIGFSEMMESFEKSPLVAKSFCKQLIESGYVLYDGESEITTFDGVDAMEDDLCVYLAKQGVAAMLLQDMDVKDFDWVQ